MKLKSRVVLAASSILAAGFACAGVAAAAAPLWLVQTTPTPTSGAITSGLTGIACTSANACLAVGSYAPSGGSQTLLAEKWNGTTWTIEDQANPTGSTSSELSGVSCWSATACMAVGSDLVGGAESILAESWNGTTWTVKSLASPSDFDGGSLNGVACASATVCTVVGNYFDSSSKTTVTLAEGLNGTTWLVQPTESPSTFGFNVLTSVSCTSGGADCTAAGWYYSANNSSSTLAERWTVSKGKGSWALQSSKNMKGPYNQFAGVSCPSAKACVAVGYYVPKSSDNLVTLAEAWNGTTWSVQPTVDVTHDNQFTAVSCLSVSSCTAVGWGEISTAGLPVIEQWNGSTWAVQSEDYPGGATMSALGGVSCPLATACSAVGYAVVSSVQVTMAEGY